ncbi:DUF1700 domain-containing protein [Eubacteriales bacterium KG127]
MSNIGKENYLSELKSRISRLPHEEYEDAISYFAEYIDEANLTSYNEIVKELGTPKEAAKDLLVGMLRKDDKAKKSPGLVILAVLAVLAAPMSIPILIFLVFAILAAAGFIIAIFGMMLAGVVALGAVGIKSLIVALGSINAMNPGTWMILGMGIGSIGAAILIVLATIYIVKFIIMLFGKLLSRSKRKEKVVIHEQNS